jgi:hypothetical protein
VEISFLRQKAKNFLKVLKTLFQTRWIERLFASANDSNALASHRHRIARVPWELHEP